jgi:hypothetical protein
MSSALYILHVKRSLAIRAVPMLLATLMYLLLLAASSYFSFLEGRLLIVPLALMALAIPFIRWVTAFYKSESLELVTYWREVVVADEALPLVDKTEVLRFLRSRVEVL